MKWTYNIKNKVGASISLFALCLLVLISNYIDRDHTDDVKNAISTLYEDRLIAEKYILKMTSGVYQLKEAIIYDTNSATNGNTIQNLLLNIRDENNAYQKTKFTDSEKIKAKTLINILHVFEQVQLSTNRAKLDSANRALVILNELSAIQLEESKKIIDHAESLYITGKTSSQIVTVLIFIILVVIQALLFASKTISPIKSQEFPHLN